MSNIVIISGSPSTLSRSSAISTFLERIIVTEGNQVSTITVRNLPPEDLIYAQFNSPAVQQAKSLVEQAAAVIIVSPVYKASYPGVLKTFLDLIPEKGFADNGNFMVYSNTWGQPYLGTTKGGRLAHFSYFRQVAQAADRLGYTGVLIPTGRSCEDPWTLVSSLAADTERLKFLIAVRPGIMSPLLQQEWLQQWIVFPMDVFLLMWSQVVIQLN